MGENLNSTPSAERLHIGIFGKRNAGKSALINAMTGQDLAIVSEVEGTTTDPVSKSMELLPLGPVVIIDTPGIDDQGELGGLRVNRSLRTLNRVDLAILVIRVEDESLNFAKDKQSPLGVLPDKDEQQLILMFQQKHIPYLIVYNVFSENATMEAVFSSWNQKLLSKGQGQEVFASADGGWEIGTVKERLGQLVQAPSSQMNLTTDLVKPGETAVLVIPIDKAAPKGRLILPEQMVIRDLLDHEAQALVCREDRLTDTLAMLKEKPVLVITDSQAFEAVAKAVPEEIPLTSFSILMARYKGDLENMVKAVRELDYLQDGDHVLIGEGCTHHRQCGDIGTEKIPGWVEAYTGKRLNFSFTSGKGWQEDLSPYRMIIHCGGCMLTGREMKERMRGAADQGIPFANYGMVIAKVHGILERSLAPFPAVAEILENPDFA
jgi:[FeFe] hydrogenase H-cluster maturation GTPase HydF